MKRSYNLRYTSRKEWTGTGDQMWDGSKGKEKIKENSNPKMLKYRGCQLVQIGKIRLRRLSIDHLIARDTQVSENKTERKMEDKLYRVHRESMTPK